MSDVEIYRRKADSLLAAAAAAEDLGERSRLISEAVRWHMLAEEAQSGGDGDGDGRGAGAPPPDAGPDGRAEET